MALDPGQAQARLGVAMALLGLGRLREGFAAYEARWLDPRFRADTRDYAAPLWLGECSPAGRTILLHAEQGFGDSIQFARYASLLRAGGARVVLEVQEPLLRLLAPLADAAIAAGEMLPPHDLRTPLLSLPHACGTELGSVPAAPYLPRPPARFDLRGPGLNVALTIAGNRDHPEDALRSLPADLLSPLLLVPGVTWHLLQPEMSAADAAWIDACPALRGGRPALGDFADTAAVLAAMDLAISVDTAVAHLAGALALPVWTLLQHAADFRWLRGPRRFAVVSDDAPVPAGRRPALAAGAGARRRGAGGARDAAAPVATSRSPAAGSPRSRRRWCRSPADPPPA